MLMPDVNVLVYAHRADLEAHRPYREWIDDLVNGPEPFGVSILVAVGFVRRGCDPEVYRVTIGDRGSDAGS